MLVIIHICLENGIFREGHFENGTWPFNRGFEESLTLLNGGADHFGGFPNSPAEKIEYAENGKVVPRPGTNRTLFQ